MSLIRHLKLVTEDVRVLRTMNITENSDLNKMGKSSKFSAREMARTFREHAVLVKDLISFPALISRDPQ